MQVHPAVVSWAGVTPSAAAVAAVTSVAPPASAAASAAVAIRDLTLIRGIVMVAFPFLISLPPPEVPVADADWFALGPGGEVTTGAEGGR
jgi:hypothetical protein